MPGTNLTRDEAATRAALLDVTSYAIDLDLTTARHDLRLDHHDPVQPAASPAPRPSPTWSAPRSTRSRSTASPSTRHGVRRQPDRADRPGRPTTSSWSAPTAPTRRTGEGLHRFVDPADDRVYLYSQFEVPDARRVFTTFEQPDLKAPFTFHVTAPAHWKVVSNSPTPEPEDRGRRARPVWHFPPTKPMSTYITALVAGEYHEVRDTYDGKHGDIPLGHYCRQSLVEHLDAEELVKLTKQGFEFFEDAFDYPYPFGKYDQLFVPEYNMGAMENAGCVTLPRRVPPPQPPGPRVLRGPRRGDPARDGAHVVRRPGDDEVVGRPLAQRVVRRVGLLPRRGRGHRVHRGVDRLLQRPQELGLPPGPAAHHPPDRGRQLRPRGRRGELRRHHLRQGRLGAQAARRLGRPGQFFAGLRGYFKARVSATPSSPTCWPRSRRPRAASSSRGPQEWLQTSGVNTLRAGVRGRRRRQLHVVRRPPDRRTRTTRRCAGTGSPSACTTTVDGRLVRRTHGRDRRRAASYRGRRAGRRRSSPTCCCSTTAT